MAAYCVASELVAKGRESAAVLQALLGQHPAVIGDGGDTLHGLRDLTKQILRYCDRALAALRGGTEDAAGGVRKRKAGRDPAAPSATRSTKRTGTMSNGEKGTRIEKKHTMEDSFMWRKYGQKDIRESKYPRLYFRCTYKEDHGCTARRQVQQSEVDPSVYIITYFGEHTCSRGSDEPFAPFVIAFESSATSDGQPEDLPWPSCDDDGLVVTWPEDRELLVDTSNVAELIEQPSDPVPKLQGLSSPGSWELLNGCLDWEFGDG